MTTNQQFNALTVNLLYKDLVNDSWLFTIGGYFESLLHNLAGKTTFEFVSVKKLSEILIPIPPIKEQRLISSKMNCFEPILSDFEKLEKIDNDLNSSINDTLKKSILQYAIQGKLVPQDENDEPASVLLERIRAEKKAKLGKKYVDSYIYKGDDNCYYEKIGDKIKNITEEIPFDIPNNWCWCRLDNLFEFINGDRGKNYPSKEKLQRIGKIPFISALNIKNNTIEKNSLLYLTQQQYNLLGSGKLNNKDIVLCIRGSLGKFCIYPFDVGAIASSLVILRRFSNLVSNKYISLYLDSLLFFEEILKYNNGTAQPNLGARDVVKFIVPLPPIKEQQRINKLFIMITTIIEKGES